MSARDPKSRDLYAEVMAEAAVRGPVLGIPPDPPPDVVVASAAQAVADAYADYADAVTRAGIVGVIDLCTAPKTAPPDGPEGGRWIRWDGKRYDVPSGVIYRLFAHFWGRDLACYDSLSGDAAVWGTRLRLRRSARESAT